MASSILNSDDGVISGTSGLKSTGGDDGVLVFQSKGTETARINTDKQIVAAAGTASLPVLTTTGDLNTGIYFPAADNIGFATGGTIRGRWTTDGLCFGSDTAAANALDDYEEGTWTFQFFDATSGGNQSSTTGTGHYTKIGKVVTCTVEAVVNISTSGMTGGNSLRYSLPFTPSGSGWSIGLANFGGLTYPSSGTSGQAAVFLGEPRGYFFTSTATGTVTMNVNNLTTGVSDLNQCTFWYNAA